jgi:hypothetical protein
MRLTVLTQTAKQLAMSRFNTKFTLLMSYASILSQANVSAAGKTCRRSAATILSSQPALACGGCLGAAIYGSRNTLL